MTALSGMRVESPPAEDDERLEIAGQWLLRLQTDSVEQHELAQWLEWYSTDDRNREAFERMQGVYESMRTLPTQQRVGLAARLSRKRASPHWALAAAASVAAVLGLSWVLTTSGWLARSTGQTQTALYRTERAAHRTVDLPDGSRVRLGAASSVFLNYTDEARYLVLEGGEAFFEVARDSARPFIVQAGTINVRALGTAFNIRRAEERVVVTVSEGAVNVAHGAGNSTPRTPSASAIRASAGEQVVLTSEQTPLSLASVDTSAALAWQTGRLEFVNEPLHSVVSTVNRYSVRKIVLADPKIGLLTYTGTVSDGRIAEWLRALQDVFPLHATSVGNETVLLQEK